MAEPFAAVADLEAGWRTLSEAEKERAEVLLARASRKIRAARPGIDAAITAGAVDADLVGDVVCAMVKRAMSGPLDLDGVETRSETAGPFGTSYTFANPAGDLYLTKSEKADLRIGQQVAASIDLIPDPDVEDDES